MDIVWIRELEGRLNAVEGQVERLNDIIGSLMGRIGMTVVEGPFVLQDSKIDKLEDLVHGSGKQLGFGRGDSDVQSDGGDIDIEDGD
jgi:hypothetical protein